MNCEGCHAFRPVFCKNGFHDVDGCIADLVEAINAHPNLRTTTTCCGHGKAKASFMVCNEKDEYLFLEIDLQTPLETWDKYRPIHEAMLRDRDDNKR